MEDPFTPLPPQGVDPNAFAQQFAFLDDPRARAALLQGGLSLLQPPSFGDTFGGQLGRAVGSGGEAVGRIAEQDRRQQEADSKEEARAARATQAAANADTSTARLKLQQEQQRGIAERAGMQNIIRLQLIHQRYQHDENIANAKTQADNGSPLHRGPPAPLNPVLPFDQWLQGPGRATAAALGLVDAGAGAGADTGDPIARARAAIAGGKNVDAVRKRLIENGITPPDDLVGPPSGE